MARNLGHVMNRPLFCLGIVTAFAAVLLFGCKSDPNKRLDQAFSQAELIEMKFILNEELVEGVKFTYSSPEEIEQFHSQISTWSEERPDCYSEIGKIQFISEEQEILELQFNVDENCNLAWVSTDGGFSFDDSLRKLIVDRYVLVRSIKAEAQP